MALHSNSGIWLIITLVFVQYEELVHVKIPVGKRCGFVQFSNRACVEEALVMLNGTILGQQSIQFSWGRSPAHKQSARWAQHQKADPNQGNGVYYGYKQGYESYGYAPQRQDPAMYAYGAYPGYGNYQQQSAWCRPPLPRAAAEDGESFAEKESLCLMEISAMDSTNVEEAFKKILNQIYKVISKTSLEISEEQANVTGKSQAIYITGKDEVTATKKPGCC
eukprot:Gb_19028 [translate_table: standard]